MKVSSASLGLLLILLVGLPGLAIGAGDFNVILLLWIEDQPVPVLDSDRPKITIRDLNRLAYQLKKETRWSVKLSTDQEGDCEKHIYRRYNHWDEYVALSTEEIAQKCAISFKRKQYTQRTIVLLLVVKNSPQSRDKKEITWPLTPRVLDLRPFVGSTESKFKELDTWNFVKQSDGNGKKLFRSIHRYTASGFWTVKRQNKPPSRCILSNDIPEQRAEKFYVFEGKDEKSGGYILVFVESDDKNPTGWCYKVSRDTIGIQPSSSGSYHLKVVNDLEWIEMIPARGIFIEWKGYNSKKLDSEKINYHMKGLENEEWIPYYIQFLDSKPQDKERWYLANFDYIKIAVYEQSALIILRLSESLRNSQFGKPKTFKISITDKEKGVAGQLIKKYIQHLAKTKRQPRKQT